MTGLDSIIGSYRIIREIGHGGMATVFEAQHVLLPRRAAIKIMHAGLVTQRDMVRRMIEEASILDSVRHPGLLRVYECDVLLDGRPWIAMELVDGETLAAVLDDRRILSPAEVARLLGDAADVLAAVHASGVVHRDLKPANLIISGDPMLPSHVIDWGIARLGPERRITLDGMTSGTPVYMSPEQSAGEHIAPPCDIYSLGVVAYEALSGNPPFDGRTLAEITAMHIRNTPAPLSDRCGAPRELCELVHRMLEKDAAARPCAGEVHRAARAIERELSTERGAAVIAVDRDIPEGGTTEHLPTPRKLRWTPGTLYAGPVTKLARPIVPRGRNDQVHGEIIGKG